jgi:hypothetical protein
LRVPSNDRPMVATAVITVGAMEVKVVKVSEVKIPVVSKVKIVFRAREATEKSKVAACEVLVALAMQLSQDKQKICPAVQRAPAKV